MSELRSRVRSPEWERLQPFADILETIVLPASARLDATPAQPLTQSQLEDISDQIQAALLQRIGSRLHPAVWVHALKVCCYYYGLAPYLSDAVAQDDCGIQIDSAYSLLRHLEVHHGLYDVYITLV